MKEFWVVYDYGMGGAWGLAVAPSAAAVIRSLPELELVHDRPEWMTKEIEHSLRTKSRFVVGEPSTYPEWLRTVIADRDH